MSVPDRVKHSPLSESSMRVWAGLLSGVSGGGGLEGSPASG